MLNLKVKYRESFRPFAPSVLREDVADWFELEEDSPYMLLVADVVEHRRRRMNEADDALFGIDKLNVVAVRNPGGDARRLLRPRPDRPQGDKPSLPRLAQGLSGQTGCPVIVNTSFNVRGEPIVCTPEDAFRCFMGTEIEVLVAGNCVLAKERQDPGLKRDYR